MKAEYLSALQAANLFSGISHEELAAFLLCLNPRVQEYGRDEFIAIAGEPLGGVGLVLSGKVGVLKESLAGDRAILSAVKAGGLFGEAAAWLPGRLWPATVQALEPCAVMLIPPDKLAGPCSKSCRWHTAVIENMLGILAEKAMELNRKAELLAIKSMRGKLCAYFLYMQKKTGAASFTLPMNRNELADYLNVSRPSMSREMGRMRDEGIINFHLSTIIIRNPSRLT